jgi:predicted phosphodiesterase
MALLADIHGNSIALDAVLADIDARGGADELWVLGDLAAIGPDPIGVLERLASQEGASILQGNTDRYLVTGERPYPQAVHARVDPSLWPGVVEVASSFAWTHGAVVATGWLPWLAALPRQRQALLPDGTRLLGVHIAPGRDEGRGVHPALSPAELASLTKGCEADLVCVAHTHWVMEAEVEGLRVVNVGSVSNPFPPDLRASYVLLEAEPGGIHLEHRRVSYDRQAVIAAVERIGHPDAGYIARHLRGEIQPRWRLA